MKYNKDMHAGAIEIIAELNNHIAGNTLKVSYVSTPQIVTIPPFYGKTFKSRLVNAVTKIPLRLVRKSTQEYHLFQKNLNHKLERDIDALKYQVQVLQKELNDRK